MLAFRAFKSVAQIASEGASWAATKAAGVVDWANEKTQSVFHWGLGAAASGIANAATRFEPVEQCLEKGLRSNRRDPNDGKYMGNECPKASDKPPATGRLPEGCEHCAGKFPKIIYTNGIQTSPSEACETMHLIADTRCAEVMCVYNATSGMMQDLLDSKDNIDRAGRERSAHSQAALVKDMLSKSPPDKVTIFAHSQGGLITQESLIEVEGLMTSQYTEQYMKSGVPQEEAELLASRRASEDMRNVDVYSFGTAERGWLPGPKLHQFTNSADPVPKAINRVQDNRGLPPLDEGVTLVERPPIKETPWGVTTTHSMNNIYLRKLNEIHPVPKKANDKCC